MASNAPYPEPVVIQWSWNLDHSVHWNATGDIDVCSQCVSSGLPVAFQWSSSVFQLCKLTLDCHWDITVWQHQPVWFQCSLSCGIPVYWQNLVWRSLGQVTSQHATPYLYNDHPYSFIFTDAYRDWYDKYPNDWVFWPNILFSYHG